MRVAILYICTGRYNHFFKGFYESAEKYFLRGIADKEYFVFTDDMDLSSEKNVHLNYKKYEGFPLDSLFKFDMFLRVESEISQFDYVYFFNSNAEFRVPVGKEILPDESGLAMGIWPGRDKQLPIFYPYERNKKSLAYVKPFGKNYVYYMGGLNGGTAQDYLQLIKTLSKNIRDDYNRGIIARVHDESHINAYMRHHSCKIIGQGYCWPEEWPCDFSPKIVLRDKAKAFPDCVDFTKGRDHSLWGKVKKALGIAKRAIMWYV